MKKVIIAALAVFFIAGLVTSAYAEDRLGLSGSYRVRAFGKENYQDFNNNDDNDDQAYWDQRFRLGGVIQVSEGISAHFRMDLSEAQWGQQTTTNQGWNRGLSSNVDSDRQIQIDRAYARWEKDFWILNAGQAFTSFGNQIVVDQNQFGFILRLKLPVVVDLVYSKIDEGGSLADGGDFGDIDFFGGQANYQADNWSIGGFVAGLGDGNPTNNEPIGFGLFGTYSYGMFAFNGEFNTFAGTQGRTAAGQDIDARGTQIYGDIKANVMPNLYFGLEGWWSDSQRGDTKTKVTGLTDSDSWTPEDWGTSLYGAFVPLDGLATALGNTTKNIPIFDVAGDGNGGIGVGVYGNWRFFEKWQLRGKFMYIQPESTSGSALDYVNLFNLGLIWDCLPNTTARVGYQYTGPSENGGPGAPGEGFDLDRAQAIAGQLQLSW